MEISERGDTKRDSELYRAFILNSSEAIYCINLERPLYINAPEEKQIDHLYEYAYVAEANNRWARIANFNNVMDLIGLRLEDIMPRSIPQNIAFLTQFIRSHYRLKDYETVEVYKTGVKINAINSVTGIVKKRHLVKIWGTGRDITGVKKIEKELRESRNELRNLAGSLIQSQEEELRRLARELRDGLTQRLAVISIEAGKIEQIKGVPWDALQKVLRIKDQLIKISKDVHNMSRNLHPSMLEELGLERAVRSECASSSSRTGIAVIFTPKNIPFAIPDDISLAVYRIIQEGLLNIARHAHSRNAYVFLEVVDNRLQLSIRDTGGGFDPEKIKGRASLGLGSMRERVRLVRGKISITSTPGKGTSIDVEIPLSQGV